MTTYSVAKEKNDLAGTIREGINKMMQTLLVASLLSVVATGLYFLPATVTAMGDMLRGVLLG